MTGREYAALLAKAKSQYPRLTISALRRMRTIYEQASDDLAAKILAAETKGLSELTLASWKSIQTQIDLSAAQIATALKTRSEETVLAGSRLSSKINVDYLVDVTTRAGVEQVTRAGIRNMYMRVNENVVQSMVNRIYQDGYTFSERIWKAAAAYGPNMKNVITAGLAQGRDIVTIAKDVQVYVRKGKQTLVTRFGDLTRESKKFMQRIGNRVDYNALRLIRSELYSSMQDANKLASLNNPACLDLFDWVRGGTQDWDCECPDYAANSPYTADQVPDYPHPHCLCTVRPRLRDYDEFFSDLKAWSGGGNIGYLDDWYATQYAG